MYTAQLFLVASVLALQVSGSCMHGTSLMKRAELPGGRVAVSTFGYTGLNGPLNWAGLAPENAACDTAAIQSPINIDSSISLATQAPVLKIDSVEAAEFENLGTTIEVIVNGTTMFAGKEFTLKQFHFHTPSEHRISEEYFPLEMHMVHEAADGSGALAVIGVTFQLSEDGKTTELLTAVTKNLGEIIEPGTVTETGPLDFTELINHIQTTPLFQYTGSLTTPPCADGLTFLVTSKPLPLNVATFNAVKAVVKFNSRYTQNTATDGNLLQVAAQRAIQRQILPDATNGNRTVKSPSIKLPITPAKACIFGACYEKK
ncbi:alpha carbonic anhydrase [Peziza echinospora]|nr:alpha carbonic anhydrase [Peziza echinospora]